MVSTFATASTTACGDVLYIHTLVPTEIRSARRRSSIVLFPESILATYFCSTEIKIFSVLCKETTLL